MYYKMQQFTISYVIHKDINIFPSEFDQKICMNNKVVISVLVILPNKLFYHDM